MDKHTRIVFNQKHSALISSSLSRPTLHYVQINKLSTDLGIKLLTPDMIRTCV